MSDDEEGEYNTIKHTTSGRGVKLLYSKSKVRHITSYKQRKSTNATRSMCTHRHPPKITSQASWLSYNKRADKQ